MKSSSHNSRAISKLCPTCGLCCNGVLFGDVELQRDDDAKLLAKLGVEVFRKGRKTAFSQPCDCLVKGLCTIYANRPKRCAAFDCGLLKRVQNEEVSAVAALKKIAEAKRRAAEVLKLLRELGNDDETLPLNQRYSIVIAQPIDMASNESEIERRGELMMAVSRLTDSLGRDFLT
ncbi:MAG: YkgJ family cysteine cluster protein [Verrucomicrobia bacterium]|nr:MAG: YkgJ family cysteine cluster protein [Verrucomicrobiota bacterium]